MQAGTKSALPAPGVIDSDIIVGSWVATDGCNACCSCTVGRSAYGADLCISLACTPGPLARLLSGTDYT